MYLMEQVEVVMLPKRYRLRDNRDFSRVFRQGKSVANRFFVCYTLDNSQVDEFRVGFSVSKKIGKAVVRNRVKRRMREAVRLMKDDIKEHQDIVLIARIPSRDLAFSEVKASISALFAKAGVFREERK